MAVRVPSVDLTAPPRVLLPPPKVDMFGTPVRRRAGRVFVGAREPDRGQALLPQAPIAHVGDSLDSAGPTSLPAVVFFFLAFENTPGTFYRYIGLMPQKTRNGQRADSHPPSVGVGVSVAHGRAFFPTGAPTRQMGREHRCEASLQVARRQP